MKTESRPSPENLTFAGSLGANPVFLRFASAFIAAMKERATVVFDQYEDGLLDMAQEGDSDLDRHALFSSAMTVRNQKDELVDRFIAGVSEAIRGYCRKGPSTPLHDTTENVVDVEEMRILDESDVAETLARDAAIKRAEGKFTMDLHALAVRLGKLAARKRLKTEEIPVGPRLLVQAFLNSLDDLDFEVEHRIEALRVFSLVVLGDLTSVYDELNQLLADAGIEPNLKWEPRQRRHREEGKRTSEREAPDSESAPGAESASGAERYSPQAIQDAARSRQRGYLEGWLYGSIEWLMNRRRAMSGDHRTADSPGIDRSFLTRQLMQIQQESMTDAAIAQQSFSALKSRLSEAAAAAGMPQNLTIGDENAIDSVGMMFDFVAGEADLPQQFQSLMRQMQAPYIRAALGNPDLLRQADHPAKALLNRIAEAGLGWTSESDRGGRIAGKAQQIVEQLVADQSDDPTSVFEDLHQEFDKFLTRQRRSAELRAKREREAMAGRERLRVVRHEVGQFLMEQTANRNIPGLVDELLRKSWAHVMVLTALQHGKESEQWEGVVTTARELIWSVTMKPERETIQRLKTRLPVLGKALANGLRKVGYGDAEISKLLASLKRLYQDMIRKNGTDHVIVEYSADGLVIRGDDISEFADDDPFDHMIDDPEELGDILGSVRDWRAGQWLLFSRDAEEPLRAKLSWISPITGRYLFVDQAGCKAGEYSPHELAENLIGERLRPLDDEEVSVRAMTAVANKLQEDIPQVA